MSARRDACLQDWLRHVSSRNLQLSETFSVSATLGSPIAIQAWNINGLPKDAFSIDNAVIIQVGYIATAADIRLAIRLSELSEFPMHHLLLLNH